MKAPRLTEKDKRSVAVLGLFLALAGYYHFVFEPVYTRWKAADKVMKAKTKELKQMEKKLREYRSIQRERDEFVARVSLVTARVKMPPLGSGQHEVLKAVMTAAGQSAVKIINVRPVAATEGDGKAGGIKAFAVEGNARTDQFVSFMEKIWGMKIEELSLSLTDDKEKPVHFYTLLTLLPVAETSYPAGHAKVGHFSLKQDPFRAGEPLANATSGTKDSRFSALFAKPSATGLAVPSSEQSFSIAGLRLVGITSFDKQSSAIVIDDSQGGKELYLVAGDRVKGYVVAAIDSKGVTLRLKGSADARLEFPPRSGFDIPAAENAPSAAAAGRTPPSARHGRLGFQVANITAEIAKLRGLSVKEGLMVTQGRGDVPEVKINDLIISMNGIRVPSLTEAQKIMYTIKAGDDLELGIISNGEAKKVKVKAVE